MLHQLHRLFNHHFLEAWQPPKDIVAHLVRAQPAQWVEIWQTYVLQHAIYTQAAHNELSIKQDAHLLAQIDYLQSMHCYHQATMVYLMSMDEWSSGLDLNTYPQAYLNVLMWFAALLPHSATLNTLLDQCFSMSLTNYVTHDSGLNFLDFSALLQSLYQSVDAADQAIQHAKSAQLTAQLKAHFTRTDLGCDVQFLPLTPESRAHLEKYALGFFEQGLLYLQARHQVQLNKKLLYLVRDADGIDITAQVYPRDGIAGYLHGIGALVNYN